MQNAARVLGRFQPSVANSQQNVRARSLRKSCSLRWPREFTCCTNRWCMRCGHRTRFRARLHSRFIYLRTWRGGPMRLENAGERQKLPYRHGLQRWICPGWVQRWRTCRAMNMVEPVFFISWVNFPAESDDFDDEWFELMSIKPSYVVWSCGQWINEQRLINVMWWLTIYFMRVETDHLGMEVVQQVWISIVMIARSCLESWLKHLIWFE